MRAVEERASPKIGTVSSSSLTRGGAHAPPPGSVYVFASTGSLAPKLNARLTRKGVGSAPELVGAALFALAFTLIFSIFVNAPLLELANFNETPNPSKAPWYFLGLQELLTVFHPMVAGVTIPGIGLFFLMFVPYIDRNPSAKPEDRKFAVSLMTVHLMFWAVLTMIGSFFRGPGFNFVFPWEAGLFFEL